MARIGIISMLRNTNGFTLAELMVVVGMTAVILAISLPYLIGSRNNQYYRQAADGMLGALRKGRSAAIATNAQQMVVFKPNSSSFQIFSSTSAGGWKAITGTKTVVTSSATIRSGATGASTANIYVKFAPNGTAQFTSPANAVSDSNISVNAQATQKYLLSVTATGRITLQKK